MPCRMLSAIERFKEGVRGMFRIAEARELGSFVHSQFSLFALTLMAFTMAACSLILVNEASALPINTDMFDNQPSAGQIMRPLPDGSVPIGSLERQIESREVSDQFENPVSPDARSIVSGRRLFAINCTPCHGSYEGGYQSGELARFGMPPINLTEQRLKNMSDGYFFSYIHFGGLALMPAYGWKFSIEEHWDIVNYIREIQNEE